MPGPKYEPVSREETNGDEKVQIVTAKEHNNTTTEPLIERNDIMHQTLITISVITCYFVLSIILTFYNQEIYKTFKYPLTVTMYHLLIKFTLSAIVRLLYKLKTGQSRILLGWRTNLMKVGPTGLCSGVDIGFSSWGLELVTVSLYTMTKSTSIIFILFFAILFRLERKSWNLLLIVGMISGGLIMFTYKSTQFNAIGFSLVLFAAFISGIRWTLAQLIMQKSNLGLHNPIDMVFHMQPFMLLSILPVTMIFEGSKIYENFYVINELDGNTLILWIFKLSAGAFIAFIMELSEFLTISYTSSLTLSVVGIFKEICQLVLAVEFNHDQLTTINVVGLVFCLGGIICHVLNKYFKYMQQRNSDTSVSYETYTRRMNQTDNKPNGHQRARLLDNDVLDFSSSSDEDSQAEDGSRVIFDVLKRRDHRR